MKAFLLGCLLFIIGLVLCVSLALSQQMEARMSLGVVGGGTPATGGTPTPDPTDQIGATGIVRSVGVTATALFGHDATGGPFTMTIAGNIATFNGANNTLVPFRSTVEAGKVGVGDIISYTESGAKFAVIRGISVDANGAKAYVYAPALTTAAVDSSTVTATTTNDTFHIWRAYTSLATWNAGTENANSGYTGDTSLDLTDAQVQKIMHAACYADGADTTYFSPRDWVTSADYYVRIFTPTSSAMVGARQRHLGVYSTSYYRFEYSDTSNVAIDVRINFLRIEGLQFKTPATSEDMIKWQYVTAGSTYYFSHNIVDGAASTAGGLDLNDADATLYAFNNIIYDFDANYQGAMKSEAGTIYAYNNTIVNCYRGYQNVSGTFYAYMNLASDSGATGFSGTFTGNYNASTDATSSGGAQDLINQARGTAFTFTNYAGKDFHLTGSYNGTTDQSSGKVTDDIDGNARSGTFDIGADEYVS